ncbi:MAG: SRPBCC family protein [Candidatus Eremiobacteraeota bacterium]|nr:SRPBCC family protein [Candidatus Eremiobacteraeota bacterium]
MAVADDVFVPGPASHSASLDLSCSAQEAFSLLCSVEKWPVWLSMLRSARRTANDGDLGIGSEVVIRSSLPGEEEQAYEVDALIPNYRLSLVGAYSVRRRLDFRIEQKGSNARLHVHISYPAYHGKVGKMLDRWQRGRRLSSALDDSLVHFKGLVEYRRDAPVLADF